jgi:hypothetical protein
VHCIPGHDAIHPVVWVDRGLSVRAGLRLLRRGRADDRRRREWLARRGNLVELLGIGQRLLGERLVE